MKINVRATTSRRVMLIFTGSWALTLPSTIAQERTGRLDSLGWSGSVSATALVQSGDIPKSAIVVFADAYVTDDVGQI